MTKHKDESILKGQSPVSDKEAAHKVADVIAKNKLAREASDKWWNSPTEHPQLELAAKARKQLHDTELSLGKVKSHYQGKLADNMQIFGVAVDHKKPVLLVKETDPKAPGPVNYVVHMVDPENGKIIDSGKMEKGNFISSDSSQKKGQKPGQDNDPKLASHTTVVGQGQGIAKITEYTDGEKPGKPHYMALQDGRAFWDMTPPGGGPAQWRMSRSSNPQEDVIVKDLTVYANGDYTYTTESNKTGKVIAGIEFITNPKESEPSHITLHNGSELFSYGNTWYGHTNDMGARTNPPLAAKPEFDEQTRTLTFQWGNGTTEKWGPDGQHSSKSAEEVQAEKERERAMAKQEREE